MSTIEKFREEKNISINELVDDVLGLIDDKIAIESKKFGGLINVEKLKNYKKIIYGVFNFTNLCNINADYMSTPVLLKK